MKKGIIVLLITVLVAGMAFAGLTGSADVKGNLDLNALKAKDSALAIANDSEISVDFGIADLAVAPAALEEGAEAPAISVDFSASFTFKVDKDGETAASAEISKASVKGANWEVSILGSADAFNYASMYGYNAKSNYAKNPGITVSYDGFTLGLGYSTKGTWNASLESKAFELVDGLTVQGGVSYSATAAAPEYGYYWENAAAKSNYYGYGESGVLYTNADGTFNTSKDVTTGKFTLNDGKGSVTGYAFGSGASEVTLASLQKAVNDAQDAYDGAEEAFEKEPSEDNYKALDSASYDLYIAKLALSYGVIEVKALYYDTYTYNYVDEEGIVKSARVWGGLKENKGVTVYCNIGDDAISELGASLKVNYASDMLNAGVAADLIFDILNKAPVVDAKANVSFMGAGLDVYYSNLGVVKVSGSDSKVPHVLNAQLTFDVNKFVELPVAVSGSVGMENILGKAEGNGVRVLKTSLAVGYDAFSLSAAFNYKLAGTYAGVLSLSGELAYAHELVTAKVGASYGTVLVVKGERDESSYAYVNQLGMYVSLENTSLIPGATLGLSWSADDLTSVNSSVDNKIGIVTASCSIAF